MVSLTKSFDEFADRDLERRVLAYLSTRQAPSLRNLSVSARGGLVILRGRVSSLYEKQLSQSTTARVAGVLALDDRIEVRPTARRHRPLARQVSFSPALSHYFESRRHQRTVERE